MKKSAKGKQSGRKKMKPRVRSEKNDEAEVPECLGCGGWQAGPASPQSQAPSEVLSPGTTIFKTDGKGLLRVGEGAPGAELCHLHSHHPHSCPEPPLRPPGSRPHHLETSALIDSVSFTLTANPRAGGAQGLPETEGREKCLQWVLTGHAAPG